MHPLPSTAMAEDAAKMRRDRRRRRRRVRRLRRLLFVVFVVAWFQGAVGYWLAEGAAVFWRPRSWDNVRITAVHVRPVPVADAGLELRVSSRRMDWMLREALGWRRHALPPGLIRDGLTVLGTVRLEGEIAGDLDVVVAVCLDAAHDIPRLRMELPADWFNAWLAEEEGLTRQSTTGRYPLGTYDLTYEIRFDTLSIRSASAASLVRRPVVHRRVQGEATGRVRCWFRHRALRARTTASVSDMRMKADVRFLRYMDGVALTYDLRIPVLEGDFRNVAPFFDARLSERIREALERSFNRSRRKERLERRRLPSWIPTDLDVDFALTPGSA